MRGRNAPRTNRPMVPSNHHVLANTNGGPLGTSIRQAGLGMTAGKSGRTTQLTNGRVTAVGVTINVNYGDGRVARFVTQIAVRSPSGNFSAGGDSGSVIWTWDARRAPVALLFAGGGTTFTNPITSVLAKGSLAVWRMRYCET